MWPSRKLKICMCLYADFQFSWWSYRHTYKKFTDSKNVILFDLRGRGKKTFQNSSVTTGACGVPRERLVVMNWRSSSIYPSNSYYCRSVADSRPELTLRNTHTYQKDFIIKLFQTSSIESCEHVNRVSALNSVFLLKKRKWKLEMKFGTLNLCF